MRTARKLAREFQSGVDQIVREAELDEARKTVQQASRMNIGQEIEKVVDPTGETRRQLNTDPTKEVAAAPAVAAKPAAASPALASPVPPAPAAEAGREAEPVTTGERNA
jgi:sec-independent protein translocase protein TatB